MVCGKACTASSPSWNPGVEADEVGAVVNKAIDNHPVVLAVVQKLGA